MDKDKIEDDPRAGSFTAPCETPVAGRWSEADLLSRVTPLVGAAAPLADKTSCSEGGDVAAGLATGEKPSGAVVSEGAQPVLCDPPCVLGAASVTGIRTPIGSDDLQGDASRGRDFVGQRFQQQVPFPDSGFSAAQGAIAHDFKPNQVREQV